MRKYISYPESTPDEGLLNLTPLIDVVFVVLLTFVLIAPMLDIDQIALAKTGSERSEIVAKEDALKIYVKKDNSIWIQKKQITEKELSLYLKRYKKNHPLGIPQVFHDKNATFGTYQMVKNALETSGFKQMDVVLKPN